ncbi:MAG: hypothetical protein PHW53_05145, partial [Patescibacteria group bacterium]|nr:hypothetical protein [Patescibacteria group bacterium]
SDSIPARLSKGEAVLPAAVVKHYGKAFVKKLIASVPADKGAVTTVEDGVVHAAGGIDPDALERINKPTGVTGGGQASIPLPADQANAQMASGKQLVISHREFIPANDATIAGSSRAPITPGTGFTTPEYEGGVLKGQGLQTIPGESAKVYTAQPKGFTGPTLEGGFKTAPSPEAVAFNNRPAYESVGAAPTQRTAGLGGIKSAALNGVRALGAVSLPSFIDAATGSSPDDLAVMKENSDIYKKKGLKGVIGHEYDKVADKNGEIADSISGFAGKVSDKASRIWNGEEGSAAKQPATAGGQPLNLSSPVKIGDSLGAYGIQGEISPKINLGDPNRSEQVIPISPQEDQQPYYSRGEIGADGTAKRTNIGDRTVTTFDNGRGGSASVQFADGRTLGADQKSSLQKTIERNADPDVKARFARDAQVVNDRIATREAGELAARQAQQQNSRDAQIQQAYNTLLQPLVRGDMLGANAQRRDKEAAKAFLGIVSDNQQKSAALANDQQQFGLTNKLASDKFDWDKESSLANAQAASAQNKFENEIKTKTLQKPQIGETNTYTADGLVNGQKAYAVTVDPKTGLPVKTDLGDNGLNMDSLYMDAIKTAHAEKDPKKRQLKLEDINKRYQDHFAQQ